MRLSLDESLEAYTKRHAFRSVDEARPFWRQDGLYILLAKMVTLGSVQAGVCRIAPGVAVPTNAVTWSDEP